MPRLTIPSPIDQQVLGVYETSDPESIHRTVADARHAGAQWAAMAVKERCRVLQPLSQLILADLDHISALISRTTGKVLTEVLLSELSPVLSLIQYYQKHAARILATQPVRTSPWVFPGATAQINRRPYGVVGIISPWNYPFQITVLQLLTALYAGNAVVIKPSELSLPVGQLIMDLLGQLALPAGLVQLLVGDGVVGQTLIDARPDLLVFTGSTRVGRLVMQRAAQHPIPVLLELGGKDAMLVFADADLARACQGAVYGAFCNSGQACVSVERLLVEASCYPAFLNLLRVAVADIKLGHGTVGDLGAMVCQHQIELVKQHYEDALAKGAKASGPLLIEGHYVKPVILWDVTLDMRIAKEETFGPLLPVMPFQDAAQAVALANSSNFGLNASVWSRDIAKAEHIAKQLQVGNWVVNDVLKNIGHPGLPFGGVKNSGFGRYLGAEGLRNFTQPISGLSNSGCLPKEPNWFPYSQATYQDFKAYLDVVYGSGCLLQRMWVHWQAVMNFTDYITVDWRQQWHNVKLMWPWKQEF